ncbi:MAG: DUF885 domain-containing protein, partial [Sciscionella sp.]
DDAGLTESALNVIESPVHQLRMLFDLMPNKTEQDFSTIATRLAKVPDAVAGIQSSLRRAAQHGRVSALRQVRTVAQQCRTWSGASGEPSYFDTLVGAASGVSESLRERLADGATRAARAYGEFSEFLTGELAAKAPEKDAVGIDVYRLNSELFTGATLNLAEAYEWGWQEFLAIEAEMNAVADRISSGASIAEAAQILDSDPRYRVASQDELVDWMQRLSDSALKELRGQHFTIPDELMTLACRIAPPGGGIGAYYTGPSDDFSRPGTMWWSVAADRAEFATWREVTTVYHEGVPGHHLQVGTAVQQAGQLNSYQRLMSFTSGHGEGWALYAEALMRELGHFDDDGNLLGMLDAQLFRAARVIVDIGMHLELEIPRHGGFHAGERWTPQLGLEFLLSRTITEPDHVRDEIDRYLGWPGQAPAYKLGQRLWLGARDDARRRHGSAFDPVAFHTAALRMGGMGLDTLREQLARL